MITIVGAGALGSHVALFLRNEKSGLKIVDFDRVEQKNTQAQFHTKMSLGKNKTQALQQGMRGLFDVRVDAAPYRMTKDNAAVLICGSDIVVDCTDNIEARVIISAAAFHFRLPCIHGALSAAGDFAQVIWDEHFKPDAESKEDGATCVDGEHLPFFAMAAAHLAVEIQSFLKTKKRRSWQITPSGVIRVA
jgi:molybdopterin/thiamine biosynthesis adenylyltransferase